MEKSLSYALMLSVDGVATDLTAEFVDLPTVVQGHPTELFGSTFKASLQDAVAAFSDPNVREVPVFRAGSLAPIAWVRRNREK